MKMKTLLSLCSALTFLSLTNACDKEQKSSLNIIRGQPLAPDSPALNNVVGLSMDGRYTFCTGSIVADDLVVTAAHCVRAKENFYVVFGEPKNLLHQIAVEKVETYKPYQDAAFPNFDIAWLKLKSKVPARFKPMEILRDPARLKDAKEFRLAGYGIEKTVCRAEECSDELLEANTALKKYHDNARLMSLLVFNGAAELGFGGACNGDSGGPAYAKIDEKWYLIGVTNGVTAYINPESFVNREESCEQGSDIYTYMGDYIPWIQARSGQKLMQKTETNPDRSTPPVLVKGEVKPAEAAEPKTWADWIQYPYHNEEAWNTVDALMWELLRLRSPELTPENYIKFYEDPDYSQAQVELVQTFDLSLTGNERRRFPDQKQDLRPLGTWTGLQSLSLSEEAAVLGIDTVAQLPSLRQLTLTAPSRTRKQPVDFRNLQRISGSLQQLTLTNFTAAELSRVPFSEFKQLTSLRLSAQTDQEKSTVDLSGLTALKTLEIHDWHDSSKLILPNSIQLNRLFIDPGHKTDLQWLEFDQVKAIEDLVIGREVLKNPGLMNRFQNKSILTLEAPGNELKSEHLPVDGFFQLKKLLLSGNHIGSSAFLKSFPALKVADLRDNPLVDADCPTGMSCSFDRVLNPKTVAEYCLNTLSDPSYSYTPMVKLLLKSQNLSPLFYSDITCDSLDRSLNRLQKLELDGDYQDFQMKAVAFDLRLLSSLKQLSELSIRFAVLSNAEALAELPHLKTLSLSLVKTRELSFIQKMPKLESLTYLDFPMNNLESLSHPGLKTLGVASLQDRWLSDGVKLEAIGSKTELPALTWLSLRGNPLQDLNGLENLPSLSYLDISSTQVKDLGPLSQLLGTTVVFGGDYKLDTCPILHGRCEFNTKLIDGSTFGNDNVSLGISKWFAGQILPGFSKTILN